MGGGPVDTKELQDFAFFELATGWSFRQSDSKDTSWLPVKQVPSTVHQDLLDNGM
jgi:beta-mannosidase